MATKRKVKERRTFPVEANVLPALNKLERYLTHRSEVYSRCAPEGRKVWKDSSLILQKLTSMKGLLDEFLQ